MRARHSQEVELSKAIFEHRSLEFIQNIVKNIELLTFESSLDNVDEQGRSFYAQALVAQNKPIADYFFQLQKDNPESIFGHDVHGNTPLIYAASNNDEDSCKKILKRFTEYLTTHRLPALLPANNAGDTPLHYAVINRNDELAKLFLNFSWRSVNAQNQLGNTPLHLAFDNTEFIALLLLHNPDLMKKNAYFNTPILLLALMSDSEQMTIYKRMEDLVNESPLSTENKQGLLSTTKNKLLQAYRETLILNPFFTPELKNIIKKAYFQCAARISLKALVSAKLEFDENVYKQTPIDSIQKDVRENDGEIMHYYNHGVANANPPVALNDIFTNLIPLFATRRLTPEDAVELFKNNSNFNYYKNYINQDYIKKDIQSLNALRQKIGTYRIKFQDRPVYRFTQKEKMAFFFALGLIVLFAAEPAFIYGVIKNNASVSYLIGNTTNATECDALARNGTKTYDSILANATGCYIARHTDVWDALLAGTIVTAFFLVLTIVVAGMCLSNNTMLNDPIDCLEDFQYHISKDEWEDLLLDLNQLLTNLQYLENKEKDPNNKLGKILATPTYLIRELEKQKEILSKKKVPTQQVKDTIFDFENTTMQIEQAVTSSLLPFSLYQPKQKRAANDTVINIEDEMLQTFRKGIHKI